MDFNLDNRVFDSYNDLKSVIEQYERHMKHCFLIARSKLLKTYEQSRQTVLA